MTTRQMQFLRKQNLKGIESLAEKTNNRGETKILPSEVQSCNFDRLQDAFSHITKFRKLNVKIDDIIPLGAFVIVKVSCHYFKTKFNTSSLMCSRSTTKSKRSPLQSLLETQVVAESD
jgi:hypothetical protein